MTQVLEIECTDKGVVLILVPALGEVQIIGIRWIGGSVTRGIMTSFI